jgi:hypothetical protein
MKLPRRAGGRSAPQVPNRTMAMCPLTAARASLTTKSILGIPMSVVMIDTGTPSKSPAGHRQHIHKSTVRRLPLHAKPSRSCLGHHWHAAALLPPTLQCCQPQRWGHCRDLLAEKHRAAAQMLVLGGLSLLHWQLCSSCTEPRQPCTSCTSCNLQLGGAALEQPYLCCPH